MILAKSYAKINLGLEVINKRNDGFHNIYSVLTKINLYDEITIELANENSVIQNGISQNNNIIFKVIKYMQNNYNAENLKITVDKNIPYSSGLGGGSSNAATVIKTINALFNLNLDSKELFDIGIIFGSDIPFFLGPNTAFVKGRGEDLTFITKPIIENILLIYPQLNLSNKTTTVFQNVSNFTNGEDQIKLINTIKMKKKIEGSQFNGLEKAAFKSFDKLKDFKLKLNSLGLSNISMSGAGPSFYSILSKEESKKMKYLIEKNTNAICYIQNLL
tara:strand:- start:206 stop:1030 length:825 start_codon:yes stop_codon:yes gene_type:complete